MSTWFDLKNNPRLLDVYKTRIEIVRLIREFFWSRNFQETQTPIAVHYPSQEPYLNPIPVLFHDPFGKEERFYLHTSPEYALKKLLAVGFDKIFEICKTFRDYEQFGGTHNTEFTMIEWYRSPGKLEDIMDDTEEMFKFIADKLDVKKLKYKGKEINILESWERKSMKDLWQEYVGVDLDEYVDTKHSSVIAKSDDRSDVAISSKNKLTELCKRLGYQADEQDEYEDLFFKIFLNKIEPYLGLDKPIFIYDYPACMCSLSKLCEYDNRYAQRFELYIGRLEIANAFGELTDPDVQRVNFNKDLELRKKLNKETWPIDEDFIKALSDIKQDTAGIALGVDRMVLLFTGANDINEVIFQSVSDQI